MESDIRYYERRASEERRAAQRAITAEARERHQELACLFAGKAQLASRSEPQFAD